jgi:hypothetical protein
MPQLNKKVINVPNASLTSIKFISDKKDLQKINESRVNEKSWQIANNMKKSLVMKPLLDAYARSWNVVVIFLMKKLVQ